MENRFCPQKSIKNAGAQKIPETADNVCFRGFFISAASDAPVENTDIPEDLYPDLP